MTKRSERMRDLLNTKLRFVAKLPHIWWGVSVENKKHGLPRIAHLRAADVSVRFLSIEPLLEDLGRFNLSSIDWAIIGGESGFGYRPVKKEWILDIIKQCKKQEVAIFFKQWGGIRPKSGGRTINRRTYDEYPLIKKSENILKEVEFDEKAFAEFCISQTKRKIKEKQTIPVM